MPGTHELPDAWAARCPDRIALSRLDGADVTYGALREQTDAIAARLLDRGARPGSVVGLAMSRSPLSAHAVLGVWKAGAAYVPLPPEHPRARLDRVVATTSPVLVLDEQDVAALLAMPPRPCPAVEPAPNRPAYVLCTSGSTGEPKAVVAEHGGLVALAAGLAGVFGDLDTARVLQFAPLTFDAWLWDLAMSVLNGGVLCVPPHGAGLVGAELAAVVRDLRATHLSGAPSLVSTLPPDGVPGLRTLVCGGEALPLRLAADWAPRVRLFNAYGPTEATVCATVGRASGTGSPDIGRPLPGVEVRLDDRDGAPVAPGEVGEIRIGGGGVARGYLNAPDGGFSRDERGNRTYRTGDLARELPDGRLHFVGRVDDQICLRGLRVEPGDVEAALLRDPRVRAAVVSAHRDRLVAHVELARPVAVAELREAAARLLPAALVPSVFCVVPRMPLTPHGKVDRDALPPPAPTRGDVSPDGDWERGVAELLAGVLGLDRVGVTDDFFALGGTSLDLVRLQEAVAGRWDVRPRLADLLRAPTARQLARSLAGGSWSRR